MCSGSPQPERLHFPPQGTHQARDRLGRGLSASLAEAASSKPQLHKGTSLRTVPKHRRSVEFQPVLFPQHFLFRYLLFRPIISPHLRYTGHRHPTLVYDFSSWYAEPCPFVNLAFTLINSYRITNYYMYLLFIIINTNNIFICCHILILYLRS